LRFSRTTASSRAGVPWQAQSPENVLHMLERLFLDEAEVLVEVHAVADELDGHRQIGIAEVVVERVEPRFASRAQRSLRLLVLLGQAARGDEAAVEGSADLRGRLEIVQGEALAGGLH